jgi:hypothetical protein
MRVEALPANTFRQLELKAAVTVPTERRERTGS